MASFGEIVEPVSRAAWEDWDEAVPEQNTAILHWKKELECPEEIETFLIFEGKYLTDSIKAQTELHNLELMNSIPELNLQIFQSKNSNKYICTVKDYNLILTSEIVELLRPYLIVSNNVIAIQTKPLHEYQATEASTQDCVIRTVTTTESLPKALDIAFPKLEQPNIVAGVSAGVVCLREHLHRSGLAVVCYMEHPEEYQVDEMEKLLAKLNIGQKSASRPSTVLNSNLYL